MLEKYVIVTSICEYKFVRFGDCDDFRVQIFAVSWSRAKFCDFEHQAKEQAVTTTTMVSTLLEKSHFQHHPASSDESGTSQSVCQPTPCFIVVTHRTLSAEAWTVVAPSRSYNKIHGLIFLSVIVDTTHKQCERITQSEGQLFKGRVGYPTLPFRATYWR